MSMGQPTVEVDGLAAPRPQGALQTLLVFRLAEERFALPVDDVVEVIEPTSATPVPHGPPHSRMLVNVRGVITPLIDLRQRLRIPPTDGAIANRFVVLDILLDGTTQRIAFAADEVETVLEADGTALEPMPRLASRWPATLVQGVCRDAVGVIFLLYPDRLFDPADMAG